MAASAGKRVVRALVIIAALTMSFVALSLTYTAFNKRAYPVDYSSFVVREADRYDLPYDLVYAVIRTESGFRPEVESSVGARGLMQITEETFVWVQSKIEETDGKTYEDLYDPETNIRYGCKLLRLLLDEFQNDDTALCAYHAGWGNAKKWLADGDHSADGVTIYNIPFGDTKKYVAKISETRVVYQNLYGFPPPDDFVF